MSKLSIAIMLCLLLSLVGVVTAAEDKVYILQLDYDEGDVTVESLYVSPGVPLTSRTYESIYRVEVVSFADEVLFSQEFSFALDLVSAPDPEWFDESGEQIYFPEEDEVRQTLTKTSTLLRFPYFNNGKTLRVFDPSNTLLFEIDIGHLSDVCGDNVCQSHENSLLCAVDCSVGGADGFCDIKSDGVCDPDCFDDRDCTYETKEIEGKSLTPYIIGGIALALVVIVGVIFIIWWLIRYVFRRKT